MDFDNVTSHRIITGISRAVALDVHFSLGFIFWSDVTENKIKRSCIDGTNITIINDKVGVCDGLAVDWKSSQIYWTDTTNNSISVSDLEGNNIRILISASLDQPRGIVLDPEQGYVNKIHIHSLMTYTLVHDLSYFHTRIMQVMGTKF